MVIFLPPYSVDLTPIDTDCRIVKRHISRMSNIKDIFRNYYQIWCTLNSDDLEVMHLAMPKRIQAIITTNCGVTKCKITCQIFAGNEISFKIKCSVVTCINMGFNKT